MKHARAILILISSLLLCGGANSQSGNQIRQNSVTLTLLSTTDSHGHLLARDELTNRPMNEGLAKIATLVRQIRDANPATLLLDCGDTTEGTPLAYYFAVKDTKAPNPEIAVFNTMHYDAMAVGNHEFNFGEEEMWKAKSESHFPWLAANLKETYTSGVKYIQPYVIKTISGIRVGIVGFVTPAVPRWEIPAHYAGYDFEPIVDAAKRVIPEVRAKSDLVVVIMHSGLDRNPQTGQMFPGQETNGENAAWELAEQVPGIDVIFYGHTHQEMPKLVVNGVLMAQAKNWGGSLARADVTMQRDASGKWTVVSKESQTIRSTAQIPEDAAIVRLLQPYEKKVEAYLNTPIATAKENMSGELARYEDEPLVDAIQRAQMEYAHADVSLATMFIPSTRVAAGTVTIRDAFGVYPYENTLYAVEMTGAQLKDALEHAASFYPAWPFPPGKRVRLPGYNADSAEGVSYEMDLTKPVGSRIVNLEFQGKPLEPSQKLRVAVNNYRYTGGGGYSVFSDGASTLSGFKPLPVAYRSEQEIRDLLIDYLREVKTIPRADGNWRIVPDEARKAIEAQAIASERPRNEAANAPKH
ncbi:MAG TPA: 5'-nucleotidase C-terminal domain-containing protein [Candidatus Acidoferrales bacterium]|nr:5'-nucleotidase C-terminal domain-containing protein [Candidatus Acidoferrales bacterium]